MEESSLGFQYLFCGCPADGGEVGRNHARFGGMARLKRLHHGAEVFPQAGSVTGGYSEGSCSMDHVKSFELGTGGCASEDSASAGGVKSIFIVAGRDCLCDLALHFNAAMVGDQQILSTPAFDLRCSQRCREHGYGGM